MIVSKELENEGSRTVLGGKSNSIEGVERGGKQGAHTIGSLCRASWLPLGQVLRGGMAMPLWVDALSSLLITVLFLLAVWGLAASPYGDWVREFHAKRDRLQTLFCDDKNKDNSN